MPRKGGTDSRERRVIEQGDSGIWATCNKGKERQCVGELRDLFNDYAERLCGDVVTEEATEPFRTEPEVLPSAGIESEIQGEVAELKQHDSDQLFTPVRLDVQCGECDTKSFQP